jgi:hypothetical protein
MATDANVMVANCPCGFKVRYGDQHVGRVVTCKQCQSHITLAPPVEIEVGDQIALEEPEILLPDARPLEHRTTRATEILATESQRQHKQVFSREARVAKLRENGFWKDGFGVFVFATNPDSLMKSLILVVAFVITDFIPTILGALLSLAVLGLAYGFCFTIVQYSAGGDDDLPEPLDFDNIIDSVVAPLFSVFIITFGLALFPIAVFYGVPGNGIVLAASVFLSVFLWPVTVLLVALGDFWMGFRIDLAIRTVVSAFVPYLFVWFMIGLAVVAQVVASGAGGSWLPDAVLTTNPLVFSLISNLMLVFIMITSMKIIGLYYRHYSDRFPWSAG